LALSQSLAARNRADGADLQSLDILFAICMHALILAVVLMLNLWHKPVEFHPLSVQVTMISAQQLKKMQRAARPPAKVRPKKKVTKPKPAPKVKKKAPQAKLKPAVKAKTQPAADFDPFKPMESSSDVKSATPRSSSSQAADIFVGQLSEQEINRYVALIQDAVQRKWKVPNAHDVQDPLVEMVLNTDGSVNRVKILESSGNTAFDASLLRAIEAAAPFQVPRKQFEIFRNNRIRFRPLR